MFTQLQTLPTLLKVNSKKNITCSGNLCSSQSVLLSKLVSFDSSCSEVYVSRRIIFSKWNPERCLWNYLSSLGEETLFFPKKYSYILSTSLYFTCKETILQWSRKKLSALWENFAVSLNFSAMPKTTMVSENTFILDEVSYHHCIFWISCKTLYNRDSVTSSVKSL